MGDLYGLIVIEIVRLKKPAVLGTRPGSVVLLLFLGGGWSSSLPLRSLGVARLGGRGLYGLIFIEVSRMKKPVAQGTSPGHWSHRPPVRKSWLPRFQSRSMLRPLEQGRWSGSQSAFEPQALLVAQTLKASHALRVVVARVLKALHALRVAARKFAGPSTVRVWR